MLDDWKYLALIALGFSLYVHWVQWETATGLREIARVTCTHDPYTFAGECLRYGLQ